MTITERIRQLLEIQERSHRLITPELECDRTLLAVGEAICARLDRIGRALDLHNLATAGDTSVEAFLDELLRARGEKRVPADPSQEAKK